MISLPAMIERAARLNPKGTATRYAGRQYSWAQVANRISRLGGALRSFGFDEGDQVAILSLNSDRYYESTFAVPWAGYCVVPLNTRWALPENSYAVKDSEARAIVFDDAFTEQAQQLVADVEALEIAIYAGEGDCPEWAQSYETLIASNEPAVA
jgi:acyl-CoA synthetase (AMP-forming)/AMP-acid ligase II